MLQSCLVFFCEKSQLKDVSVTATLKFWFMYCTQYINASQFYDNSQMCRQRRQKKSRFHCTTTTILHTAAVLTSLVPPPPL